MAHFIAYGLFLLNDPHLEPQTVLEKGRLQRDQRDFHTIYKICPENFLNTEIHTILRLMNLEI